MRFLIAWGCKLVLKIPLLRKYYFTLHKRIFKPLNLFKGVTSLCRFDHSLRIKADLDDWIQQNIFFTGTYDPSSIAYIKNLLNEGDTFIDIGANVGCFTLVASRTVGESGRVIAFEPVEMVFKKLEYNVKLNGQENVILVKKAIYSENTSLPFHIASQENLGMSSMHRHDTESGKIEIMVATTLDTYLQTQEVPRIKLIKIDIEGAEIFALEGMENTLSRFRPVCMVEVSSNVLKSKAERTKVFDFFRDRRYDRFVINKEGELITPLVAELTDYTNFVFMSLRSPFS
jgi:FkbM family methyltransferase